MTVFAYSEDPVAAAKAADEYAKGNDKYVILGGAMGGTILKRRRCEGRREPMPSREELIASIVGCIGAPASNIAGAIGAPASNIASHPFDHRREGGVSTRSRPARLRRWNPIPTYGT